MKFRGKFPLALLRSIASSAKSAGEAQNPFQGVVFELANDVVRAVAPLVFFRKLKRTRLLSDLFELPHTSFSFLPAIHLESFLLPTNCW